MKLNITINNAIDAKNISGVHNSNIKAIEDYFNIRQQLRVEQRKKSF